VKWPCRTNICAQPLFFNYDFLKADAYCGGEKPAALSREISWSNNLQIVARAKSREARKFYLLLAQKMS